MSDSHPDDGIINLRRRTDGERLDYLLSEVALLVANLGQAQRDIEGLKSRVQALEQP